IPITGVNVLELGGVVDRGRRERLATFMTDLSCNHSLRYCESVVGMEIENAIRALAGVPTVPVRPMLTAWGVGPALAVSPCLLDEVRSSPPVSVFMMVNTYDEVTLTQEKRIDESWREWSEVARAEMIDLSPRERLAEEALAAL